MIWEAAMYGETPCSNHGDRMRMTAMPMPRATPRKKPSAASRKVNAAAWRTKMPNGFDWLRCGGTAISATMSGIGGMVRSSVRGRNDPTTGQPVWASSMEVPKAL